MRDYFSIAVLLSVVLAATACDNSPVGVPDPGGAALEPVTQTCPSNPALPAFLQTINCSAQ